MVGWWRLATRRRKETTSSDGDSGRRGDFIKGVGVVVDRLVGVLLLASATAFRLWMERVGVFFSPGAGGSFSPRKSFPCGTGNSFSRLAFARINTA